MQKTPLDARARRTRDTLHYAFTSLIQSSVRYENLKIADIATRAEVSRSTFYAHYPSKDALLAGSLEGAFSVLADTIGPDFIEAELIRLLEHFWQRRALARSILVGATRRKTVDVLVRLIAERLRSAGLFRPGALFLTPKLVAIQLSETLLAPISAWLLEESRCTPDVLAAALRRVSIAAVRSLIR